MITIHHLGVSQSERIVWLAEELGLPYKLKWYDRMPNKVAPPEFLKLHPTAMAPVIEDGDRVLTESAVIAEYLCHRYAGGRFKNRSAACLQESDVDRGSEGGGAAAIALPMHRS